MPSRAPARLALAFAMLGAGCVLLARPGLAESAAPQGMDIPAPILVQQEAPSRGWSWPWSSDDAPEAPPAPPAESRRLPPAGAPLGPVTPPARPDPLDDFDAFNERGGDLPGRGTQTEDLLRDGMQSLFEGLMREMSPAIGEMGRSIDEMRPMLEQIGPQLAEIARLMGDAKNYDKPEMLPNGDILIRRKTALTPEERRRQYEELLPERRPRGDRGTAPFENFLDDLLRGPPRPSPAPERQPRPDTNGQIEL